MAETSIQSPPAEVIKLADYRRQPPAHAAWQADIDYFCRYARVLRLEHDAEAARLDLECKQRGIDAWWLGPRDIVARINANNDAWILYRAVVKHIASIPAATRSEAMMKRAAVGKLWLRGDCESSRGLRTGCEVDDHLLPRSLRLKKDPEGT